MMVIGYRPPRVYHERKGHMQKEQKKVGMRNIEREKRDKQKISSTTEILIELALHACRLHETRKKGKL